MKLAAFAFFAFAICIFTFLLNIIFIKMKKLLYILPFALMLSGCFFSSPSLTGEESIQRSLNLISHYPEGKRLVKFLRSNPVQFEFADTAGMCHHFNLKNPKKRMIFIPDEYAASEKLLAMAVVRAANIYRMYLESGMEEIISEEEEVAMLRQMHLGVLMNLTKEEFDLVPEAKELKKEFCTYILENSEEALAITRHFAQSPMPACQRPLENIVKQGIWLANLRQAIAEDKFHQLVSDRDRKRVAQGVMTDAQASKNSAILRSLPDYELSRYERTFYDNKKANFNFFNQIYLKELYNDTAFRREFEARIYDIATDFAECDLEDLKHKYE